MAGKKLIIANWKANPLSEAEAVALARKTEAIARKSAKAEVVVAPPHIFLFQVKKALNEAKLGSQNVFWEGPGAYTGEITAAALKKLGTAYVIIGHSERRRLLGETDEMIAKKLKAALDLGLRPVLCVGEPGKVRKRGFAAAGAYVTKQLLADTALILKERNRGTLVVAYEPIWAIGTGVPDDPRESARMALCIKAVLKKRLGIKNTPVLYGGSVKEKNAAGFLTRHEIGGALVGGASLSALEFNKIVNSF